jgi:undecaprenyl-diphosphatase
MVQDFINTTFLAIIEGITEFLPISSTGHLIIAEQWLSLQKDKAFRILFCSYSIPRNIGSAIIFL